jgi:hypothetical protein
MKAKKPMARRDLSRATDCLDAFNHHWSNAWAVAELLTACGPALDVNQKAVSMAAELVVEELEKARHWIRRLEEEVR